MSEKLDIWTKFDNECLQAEEFEDKELQMQWRCKKYNGWCYFSKYCKCTEKEKAQMEFEF